jgi:predicted AAA+ superfamily ATPase
MANICLILGKSGTGKSSSIKSLNPEETIIFNILKKKLPFKGSSNLYNAEKKNLFNLDSYNEIIQYLEGINTKVPTCKNIIIDDATYIMRKEYFKTAKITGLN